MFGVEFRLLLYACVEEVLLLERILVCEDYKLNVAQILHLLLLVRYAASWNCIIRRTELIVDVVAGDHKILKALKLSLYVKVALKL